MPENRSIHREEFVVGEEEYTVTYINRSEKKDVARTQSGPCPTCGNPINTEWVPITCFEVIGIKDSKKNVIALNSELGETIIKEALAEIAEFRIISNCQTPNCPMGEVDEEPFESEEEQSEEPE